MAAFKAAFLYWKLAIFRIVGKSFMALMLSLVTSMNGSQWSKFTSTEKFVAIVTALGAMWMVIDAFLDTTMSEMRKRHNDTIFMQKPTE